MKHIINILLILWVNIVFAQYPLLEDFDSFNGVGEWTADNGAGSQNYGGAENYATFNLGSTPYVNNDTITIMSPILDFSNVIGNVDVSYPLSGYIENGWDFMTFDYFDQGVWVTDVTYTGGFSGVVTTRVPNTTTRVRFQLITDPTFIIWYRANFSAWNWTQGGSFQTPVDISNSYVGGSPRQVLVYYYDIASFSFDAPNGTLPIELTNWYGNYCEDNDIVVLTWITASEINNDNFEILHSEDTRIWEVIDRKRGAGNSNTTIKYHSSHRTESEVNYYMLRQVDYDGNEEEFSVININVPIKTQQSLNYVYFNPLGQLGGQHLKKQIK
jgi:hypothetical protein